MARIFVLALALNLDGSLAFGNRTWTSAEYILPCIANIITRPQNGVETDFLLLSEELQHPVPSDEIIRIIRHHPVVIQREREFDGFSGFFLLFPTKERSYEALLKIIRTSVHNKFLIVWPFETANPDDLIPLVNEFWSFRYLNVIILMRASPTAIHVYGYNPFLQSSCHTPRLVRLDVWSIPSQKFVYNNNLYPSFEAKTFNLNGCPLICFAKSRPPDAIVRQAGGDGWQLDGVGGRLMRLLSKRFNFTAIIQVPKASVPVDKYGYDISPGIPELVTALLVNQSIDLAFGIYSHILYFRQGTEFPSTAVAECWGWAVPARMGRKIPTWMYYTGEFTILVWFSVFSVYVTSVMLVYLGTRMYSASLPVEFQNPTYVALYVFSLQLGIPTFIRMTFTSLRTITIMISLYSLVILSAYMSAMDSLQVVPRKRENIRTLREILDTRLELKGPPQSRRLLERQSRDNATLRELSTKFRVHRGFFEEIIREMQREKNTGTFGAQRFLQFFINEELNKTGRNDVYLIPECVIEAQSSPFLLKRGSPFLHAINWIILVALEAGLTQYWFTYSTPKIPPPSLADGVRSLSIDKVTFVFVILVVGLSVSFLIFLAEVVTYRRKRKRYI